MNGPLSNDMGLVYKYSWQTAGPTQISNVLNTAFVLNISYYEIVEVINKKYYKIVVSLNFKY